jgi:hypothetical protein
MDRFKKAVKSLRTLQIESDSDSDGESKASVSGPKTDPIKGKRKSTSNLMSSKLSTSATTPTGAVGAVSPIKQQPSNKSISTTNSSTIPDGTKNGIKNGIN